MKQSTLIIIMLQSVVSFAGAQTDSLYLWPGVVPGESGAKSVPVHSTLDDGSIRVMEVSNPFLAVFTPAEFKRNRKAVVVCPGGGYVRLAAHKEGYAVADWLTDLGYTVFVLQYRVPDNKDGALQDLQRAMKIVRHKAKFYQLDPDKIGAIGFSAGAHLVARAGMGSNEQTYPNQDDSDSQSSRPDCMMIIYPGYLDMGPDKTLSPELKAHSSTVPTFIFQSMDDRIARSSFVLAMALRDAGASVELHMVPEGGHGYGMYPGNKAAETWPVLLANWLKEHL